EHAREPAARKALAALACAVVVVGSAPWLGAPFLVAITLYLARAGAARTQLAIGVGAIGALSAVYWIGALGRMPDPDFDLHPLVGAALLMGPLWRADDPSDAPSRLASDLLDEQPPGPGVFVARRAAAWNAIQYEQAIAGARPDLVLLAPLPPNSADVIVKRAL